MLFLQRKEESNKKKLDFDEQRGNYILQKHQIVP